MDKMSLLLLPFNSQNFNKLLWVPGLFRSKAKGRHRICYCTIQNYFKGKNADVAIVVTKAAGAIVVKVGCCYHCCKKGLLLPLLHRCVSSSSSCILSWQQKRQDWEMAVLISPIVWGTETKQVEEKKTNDRENILFFFLAQTVALNFIFHEVHPFVVMQDNHMTSPSLLLLPHFLS